MFPDKFMAHQGEFAPPSISFWIRYQGTCDPDSQDVVVIQTFADSDDERVILIGDTETQFMTDLGRQNGESPDLTRFGITRPGDNKTVSHTSFLGAAYTGSVEPKMLGTPAIGNIDKSIAMSMWHRNCFTLASEEYLTEEEWLARDDYRAVFQRSDGVANSETIKQQGVHIFSSDQPFQELDLIPNEYSPALHCIPNKTVGGFVFDQSNPDEYFILYDYKDYYPESVGLVVASGSWGTGSQKNNTCDTMTAQTNATWSSRQYLAYRSLVPLAPGSLLPFQPDARLTCPNQSWDVQVPEHRQVFEDDSGTDCDDEPSGPNCGSSEFCHGEQDLGSNVAYGAMGNDEVLSYSERTVEQNHPVRNRLFVQGIFNDLEINPASLEDVYSFALSDVGSDDFEGNDYVTFTGLAAFRIRTGNTTAGGLDFGRGFPSGVDLDPNQDSSPASPRFFSENTSLEFGPPYFCDCADATNEILNYGLLDDLYTSQQIYRGGNWINPTPGWEDISLKLTSNLIDNGVSLSYEETRRGTDRVIGTPQFNFP